ncbi:MAG TPA: SRPBCC domain-containing protein [Archangium sp.]|nr:SRPBCC domain-containing protein [Archangium sp.]
MKDPVQGNTSAKTQIRVTHRFSASAERVFEAWLEPARAGLWLFATPTGQRVRVEIDARVGGGFSIVERRDGEDVEHVGKYLEFERPRRLVFTFAVPKYSADSDVVEVDIVPRDGGCELTLTQRLSPEWKEQTRQGWATLLERLATVVGT